MEPHPRNKTIDFDDFAHPELAPTHKDLRRWVFRWFLRGNRLGVNGTSRWRTRVRDPKMWEYTRALALTGVSRPVRGDRGPFTILDVGGAMTLPLFYCAEMGDKVVSLDIHPRLTDETNRLAKRRGLDVTALRTNLVEEDPTAAELGAPGGFDRVFCICVIEHIVPPGQGRVAERMGKLLKPGGMLAITFDYGEHARSEAPMPGPESVEALKELIGLPLVGNQDFADDGRRYPISRRHPERPFTFGSLFFRKPDA